MYRTGHYGVAMLVYAPVGLLLGRAGHVGLAVVGAVAVVSLTPVPDYDLRVSFVSHRGPTHTLPFAALVGAVTGGAVLLVVRQVGAVGTPLGPTALVAFGFGVGAFAIVAHILGDLITPMGVPILWPLSDERYSVPVANASNSVANGTLFALGLAALAAAAADLLGLLALPV